ncbi:hypothetical protein [Streptomyces cucumeris]|uniref:hypothetical protein n=1 Tax=Streptomyces cucumeris TaxID=2962890 RepID=UPI0020C89A6F|nr:hypothetical protein [Streptomyces sp. NEAU-Y11]MCP9209307.1 hypothetical protein [Streptomyces sp. NEAU-Y11]
MRTVYVCLNCACFYLPPESMTYPRLDYQASPVHCSLPECRSAVEGAVARVGVPEDVMARWARRAAGIDGEPRRPRPGRRARGRRPASAAGGRSKLL